MSQKPSRPVHNRLTDREVDGDTTHVAGSGARLVCRRWGPSDGPPVLLLHGVQGCAELWVSVAGRLAAQGFWVVALDLRGHGRSEGGDDYGLDAHVQDALDVLDALDLAPAHVIGHSLGGTVAWTLAARHPHAIRRLVIEDQHPDPQPTAVDGFRTWAANWRWHFESQLEALEFLDSRGSSRAWWVPSLGQRPDGSWGWSFEERAVVESVRAVASASHWPELRRVRAPTLVVRGQDSEHLAPDVALRMARAVPEIRLVTLSGDHWVHRDPEPYADVVASFLAERTVASDRQSGI